MGELILLHGSDHIVENPDINLGNDHNDYGRGFYCTLAEEMAKEWACKQNTDGFVNRYEINIDGLKFLDLTDGNHTVLNWISLLLKYRTFKLGSDISINARDYLIKYYSIDLSNYDIVIGYLADDSYFQYAESFVNGGLPLRLLNRALSLGKLGKQTVLVSPEAFGRIKFIEAIPVSKAVHYPRFIDRDTSARSAFKNEIKKSSVLKDDIFIIDILREEMAKDDPRIQRIVSE